MHPVLIENPPKWIFVFSKCIYTCWMALGFEMFLSELWQTFQSYVGSTRSFDQWNVSLVLNREGSIQLFPRLEDFVFENTYLLYKLIILVFASLLQEMLPVSCMLCYFILGIFLGKRKQRERGAWAAVCLFVHLCAAKTSVFIQLWPRSPKQTDFLH